MQKRYVYLDYLRIVACFCVVLLHTIVSSVVLYGKVPLIEWDISIFISSFTRWAIPVFIMASGAVLLEKKNEKTIVFMRKRAERIGIPLVFWFLFYAFYRHLVNGLPFSFPYLFHQFTFNQPYEHLYFLVILIELMFFNLIFWRKPVSWKTYFSAFLFSIVTLLWIPSRFFLPLFVPYISYYMLGYLISKLNTAKLLKISIFIASLGIFLSYFLTRYLTLMGVTDNLYFFSFTNIVVFVTSVCMFILFKEIFKKEKENKTITTISSYTMGIYLIHPFVLYTLQYTLKMQNMTYVLLSPIISLFVFVISLFLVFLLSKIPIVCKTVGFSSRRT